MSLETTAGNYVQQLRHAGLRPGRRLVDLILACGDAAADPLIDLATSIPLLDEKPPVAYAPIHALRLLGELRPLRMVEPLLKKSADAAFDDLNHARAIWQQEMPQMIGRSGGSAVALLWTCVDDPNRSDIEHDMALLALAYATVIDEDVREPVVAGLHQRLMAGDNRTLNAGIVRAMAYLKLADMYGDVMARYRAGAVDQESMPAATARQMLLATATSRVADDAKLSLWERYDEFGPFPEPEDTEYQ
ncbi:hypothetical protein [Roseiflexus sp.]